MRPAKGKPGDGKWVPLYLQGGGSLVDPVKEVQRMLALDPVPEKERATTPLFRWESNAAFTVEDVRRIVKLLARACGLDPAHYGAHSLRIGGATAALAGGVSPAAIRVAGRWASDVYLLYTRMSKEAAGRLSRVVGSTPFEGLESADRFAEEELLLVPGEMPDGPVDQYVEEDLVEDALR
jgi:hypothetical protein